MSSELKHKHMVMDEKKLKRCQKLLGTKNERETVDKALELVLAEAEKDMAIEQLHKRITSRPVWIEDPYGRVKD
jgi:hypothetical protein